LCKSQHKNKGNLKEIPGCYTTQHLFKMDTSEGEVNEIADKEFKYPPNG
jgi:hypothetical protein